MNRLYEEGSRSYVESWLDAEKLNEKLRGMLKWEKTRKKNDDGALWWWESKGHGASWWHLGTTGQWSGVGLDDLRVIP